MTNFKTTFTTREATEARIEQIDGEIGKIEAEFNGTIYQEAADKMIDSLDMLKCKLEADIKHFDEIDAAMEQAVK